MTGPLVSVLTPVHNGERFLDAAVCSVVAQTYPNWELLLVDDGSTDGSLRIIAEWAGRDGRIKALAHPGRVNRGVSAARNLALQHASGKYVALLDCDDEWLPGKLERQVRILEADPGIVIVYSQAVSIDDAGVELALTPERVAFPPICGTGTPGKSECVVDGMIRDVVWMPTLTVVMAIDAVRALGGFDENLSFQIEDHLLFTLLSERGNVYFVSEVLARYRVHASSYTQTKERVYSMIEYFDSLYGKLPESYTREIASAKSRFIVDRLIRKYNLKCYDYGGVLKEIIISHLCDHKVVFLEKLKFSFGITWGILAKRLFSQRFMAVHISINYALLLYLTFSGRNSFD